MKLRNIKVAMLVNKRKKIEKENIKELKSIEGSVLEKIDLIKNNYKRLKRVLG